ncbi:MAG: hypothetical protein H6R27_476 [Proteobacteria bacterium]|nr:hypothetical protein [Pseudomonadota bacterium]
MSNTGRLFPAGTTADMQDLDEAQAAGQGRVEFDELGNAVWVPYGGLGSQEVLARLLNDQSLSLSQEVRTGRIDRIQPNPAGLKQGYDPYDSGMLLKKSRKPKKDLRALSKWIEQRKKLPDRE